MVTHEHFDELRREVSEVALGNRDAAGVVAEVRRSIRMARADTHMVARLRLLLGELFYWSKDMSRARQQYRKVLESHPDSTDAMIGMGDTYETVSRFESAEKCYEAGREAAERHGDHAGQQTALDRLAGIALARNDDRALSRILGDMCKLFQTAPGMDGLILMIAERLIMTGKELLGVPFLECWIMHTVRLGYSRASMQMPLRAYVEIQRRQGHSDEQIFEMLRKYQAAACDESAARDFEIVVRRVFEIGHLYYETYPESQ